MDNTVLTQLNGMLPADTPQYDSRKGKKYDIVSRVAYLIGVGDFKFKEEQNPLMLDIFDSFEKEKPARIIRHLCILRTEVIRNFSKIIQCKNRGIMSMLSMPDLVPASSLASLDSDGISLYGNLIEPNKLTMEINEHIKNHINNCKDLFPKWLQWDYIAKIFIMPGGTTEDGLKKAVAIYRSNYDSYPYHRYMGYDLQNEGNVLYSDKLFVTLLYSWNNDEFTDMSLIADLSARAKEDIHAFLDKSDGCTFIVDCENSDPLFLCAALMGLDPEKKKKINKTILYDDIHTASVWSSLEKILDYPVEYSEVRRLKLDKSLVDVKVIARIMTEYHQNHCRSFVLAASDSDYWGVIEELKDANFLVMVEKEKCSGVLKAALAEKNIPYCYLDDFPSEDVEKIKDKAIDLELEKILVAALELDLNNLVDTALFRTRIDKDGAWKADFIEKEIKNRLELCFTEDGKVGIGLTEKKKTKRK